MIDHTPPLTPASTPTTTLSLAHAAEVLGVSLSTMSAWIVDGVLPARKAEYRWEIPAAAVAALKEQREKPVAGMLTVEAVAARLGLKIIAVREYAAAGRLKGAKIGPDARRWWFREEDVAEFEASRNRRRRGD